MDIAKQFVSDLSYSEVPSFVANRIFSLTGLLVVFVICAFFIVAVIISTIQNG